MVSRRTFDDVIVCTDIMCHLRHHKYLSLSYFSSVDNCREVPTNNVDILNSTQLHLLLKIIFNL